MKIKNTLVAALFISLIFIPGLYGCKNRNKDKNAMALDPMDGPVVEMQTTQGTMKIKLYNATPGHRDNFLKLVHEGFYDSVKFHRVIQGFMIQGGDPLSKDDSLFGQWGTGGPGYTVAAEFVSELHHCKGAVAAARLGDMANPRRASSGSQFYIVQSEEGCSHLDGQYTVFGQVIEGLEVIDKIATVDTDPYDRPIVPVVIQKVTIQEKVDSTAATDSTVSKDSAKHNVRVVPTLPQADEAIDL